MFVALMMIASLPSNPDSEVRKYHDARASLSGIQAVLRVGRVVDGNEEWQYRVVVRWDEQRSRTEIDDLHRQDGHA